MDKATFIDLDLQIFDKIRITKTDGTVIKGSVYSSPPYRAAIENPKRDEHFYYNLYNGETQVIELKFVESIEKINEF